MWNKNFIIALLLFSLNAHAIEFRIVDSKILALWSFVLGATSAPIGSATSVEFYKKSSAHSEKIDRLIDEIAQIIETDIKQGFDFSKQVAGRNEQGWDARKHFLLQASIAKSLSDFKLHTSDLMPYPKHIRLFEILNLLMPIYEKVLWSPSLAKIAKLKPLLVKDFKKLKRDRTLDKIKRFYGSEIDPSALFNVHLIPIPGSHGGTHATVVSNEVFSQVFVDQERPDADAGTLVHEVSHYLYETQAIEFQEEQLSWFELKTSEYGKYLYQSWDEILATVAGNGYGFEVVKGKEDAHEWYQNREYETVSRAIYPTFKEYLRSGKKIDRPFIESAIKKYKVLLPNAANAYFRIFKSTFIVNEDEVPIKNFKNPLKRTFHYNSLETSPLSEAADANKNLKRGAPASYPDERYRSIIIVAANLAKNKDIQKLDIPNDLKEKIKLISSEKPGYFQYQTKDGLPVVLFQGKAEDEFAIIDRSLRAKYEFQNDQIFHEVFK